MTTIKDSVHDHIEITGVSGALLDTAPVQRLRRVKQLGTVSLVYPSANHTRFEHSLGVYHLASAAADRLDLHPRDAERVRAAALLHDVGHGPYSHTVEDLIERRTGKRHDDVRDLLNRGPLARALEGNGLDPDRVAELVAGEGKFGQLVAGELDVDRMDYLVRDAHHTGVPYGTIDTGRLLRALRFVDEALVLDEGNVQTAESLLLARALMNPTVYSHHVARISKAMLRRASERLCRETAMGEGELRRMDDAELFVALRSTSATQSIADRLASRNLYKRAAWVEHRDVPAEVLNADHEQVRELEAAIASHADTEQSSVVLDVPPPPRMRESSTRVLVNGEVRRLDEQSTLVNALQSANREQWRLGVYAPTGLTDRVGRAAERELGLDIDGALVAETSPPTGHVTLDEFE